MHAPTITRRRISAPPLPSADPDEDRERFAALYAQHRDELARYCRSILRHDQDVEDALQSTMAKAFAALRTETREIALRPWLFRIAHNEAISIVRRRVEPVELDDRDGGDPDAVPQAVETRERLRLLRDDLRDLPERQRSALVLRELSGLGHREIADVLGTSPSAVKQAIYEARCGLGDCAAGRSLTCDRVRRALSDGDGRTAGRRRLRAHLRSCRSCRAFDTALRQRPQDLGAIFPAWPMVGAGAAVGGLSGLASSAGGGAAIGTGSAAVGVSATTLGAGTATVGIGAVGSGGLLGGALAGAGAVKLAGITAVAVVAGGAVAVERGTFTSSASDSSASSAVVREAPATTGPALRFAAATGGATARPVAIRLPGRGPSASTPSDRAPRRGDRSDASRDQRHATADRSPARGKAAASGPAKRSAAAEANGRPDRGSQATRGTAGRPATAGRDRGTAAAKPARKAKPARATTTRSPAKVTARPTTPNGTGSGAASSASSGSRAPASRTTAGKGSSGGRGAAPATSGPPTTASSPAMGSSGRPAGAPNGASADPAGN